MMRAWISLTTTVVLSFVVTPAMMAADRPQNIVIIYADDVGYGDFACYNKTAPPTPNVDRLAEAGLRLTNGYCSSATCTPSRYSLLTGQYAFRQRGTGVLPGDANLIIAPGRTTLPSILKLAGYHTGVVGKWHLGLGDGPVDWNADIKPGPLEIGFDEAFLIPATGDRVPTTYLEGRRIAGLTSSDPLSVRFGQKIGNEPTGREHPELLKTRPSHGHDMTIVNGISRIGYQTGGKSAWWKDEDIADTITRRAVKFIDDNQMKPFFLYFSTHDIHVPRVPHERFVGKSGMGPRGDAIVQFDACVGEVLDALDERGLTKNTLVILSSDNGSVIDDGYQDDAVAKLGDHRPAGPLRGGKYSNFEGGTRVPMIVRWPKVVTAGTTSSALVSQVDFLRSFATLTGQPLPDDAAPDSQDISPALLGKSETGRSHIVEYASSVSLRDGNWKFIPANGGVAVAKFTNTELGNAPVPQLYDLSADPGEINNVAEKHPEIIERLKSMSATIRSSGQDQASSVDVENLEGVKP